MRLIDADALKEELENSKYIFGANKTIQFIQNSEIDRAISFIETAPTVDERLHGEWIEIEDEYGSYCGCSNCKWENVHWQTQWIACPKCGASMEVMSDGDKLGHRNSEGLQDEGLSSEGVREMP